MKILVSNRKSALRLAASGPWHSKQLSERIDRTSRLNSNFSSEKTDEELKRKIKKKKYFRKRKQKTKERKIKGITTIRLTIELSFKAVTIIA